jgi:hypothetical protein
LPIYAQWKWVEKTQTFLLVLHLDADGSKPNLRSREMTFSKPSRIRKMFWYEPFESYKREEDLDFKKRTVLTWAPTHVEAGLLSELLGYANIINCLKSITKEELRPKLEFDFINSEDLESMKNGLDVLEKEFPDEKSRLFGIDKDYRDNKNLTFLTFELCEEYINYLKKVLEKYK